VKLAAGWLIEQCGLKGRSIGGAAVHDKQALVLVNTGRATAADVAALAALVQNTVAERFGVELESEPVWV
ncbi:TPA: UDP-N-acetylenolpyruvoylglucosamine reductase, partial [Neisseria bacilliformis]